MKSEKYSFSCSGTIVRENFRKYWSLPLLAFAGYLMTGIFIILQYREDGLTGSADINAAADFISHLLSGSYPVYSAITAAVPVISVLLLFRYVHDRNIAAVIHSQPFTRDVLLSSNFVTAILFSVLPIALTGLILLFMAHPVYYAESYYSSPNDMVNVFSIHAVLSWIFESMICAVFVGSISLFAGMISGTGMHHFIASVGFNIVVPLIAVLQSFYSAAFLFGSSGNGIFNHLSVFSPVSYLYTADTMSGKAAIIYILVAFGVYLSSLALYKRKPLEKTGRGIVFGAFDYIITFIFGFTGMTVMGFAVYSRQDITLASAAGFAAGAFLGIVICRMIVLKTFRVFSRKLFRYMVPYAVFALVFFAVMFTGGLGYETRIPESPQACLVSVTPSIPQAGTGTYVNSTMRDNYTQNIDFKSDGGIKAVKALNRMIVKNKETCIRSAEEASASGRDDVYDENAQVSITYYSDRGATDVMMSRSYTVPEYLLMGSSQFGEIYRNDDFVSYMRELIRSLSGSEVVQADVYSSQNLQYMNDAYSISSDADLEGLASALITDRQHMTYDEYVQEFGKDPVAVITISRKKTGGTDNGGTAAYKDEDKSGYGTDSSGQLQDASGENTEDLYFVIRPCCTETLAWLSRNGCPDLMAEYGSQYRAAVVYRVDGTRSYADTYSMHSSGDTSLADLNDYENGSKLAVITNSISIRNDFAQSASPAVFGPVNELSTDKDGICYMEFYRLNEDGTYALDYGGFIKTGKLEM